MLVTALVTPYGEGGDRIDLDLVVRLVAFQLDGGVDQVLLAGTTGEGGLLDEGERDQLLDAALTAARPEQLMLSLGSGRLAQVVDRGRRALERGVRDLLLVDSPYAAPSSSALREAWHGPVARALPEARLFPYAVPSRTGCELLPDDLARLVEDEPNVVGVKDATGRLARMERLRELCGEDFVLLCGDDPQLRDAMIDPDIRAAGGCSVASNLAPRAVRNLVDACRQGDAVAARELHDRMRPLFGLGCVTAEETVQVGAQLLAVPQRCRNPVPLKTALQSLGVLDTGCREPLAPIGPNGRAHVEGLLTKAVRSDPTLLRPLADAFGLDLAARAGAGTELVHGAR